MKTQRECMQAVLDGKKLKHHSVAGWFCLNERDEITHYVDGIPVVCTPVSFAFPRAWSIYED